MSINKIDTDYFEWMCDIVCKDRFSQETSYRKLLAYLHSIEFTYSIQKDYNRAEDGKSLRYRFAYFDHYEEFVTILEKRPCSVLEMMVALAVRCEKSIMDDAQYGDRTGQWFWGMITNLGLGSMTDDKFDRKYVSSVIERFLNREYEPDGKGGLFRVRHSDYDMRTVEIWYQLCYFLDEFL